MVGDLQDAIHWEKVTEIMQYCGRWTVTLTFQTSHWCILVFVFVSWGVVGGGGQNVCVCFSYFRIFLSLREIHDLSAMLLLMLIVNRLFLYHEVDLRVTCFRKRHLESSSDNPRDGNDKHLIAGREKLHNFQRSSHYFESIWVGMEIRFAKGNCKQMHAMVVRIDNLTAEGKRVEDATAAKWHTELVVPLRIAFAAWNCISESTLYVFRVISLICPA